MKKKNLNLKTLNMCDFCSREVTTCGANVVQAREIGGDGTQFPNPQAVVACDGYESPVDVLKKK